MEGRPACTPRTPCQSYVDPLSNHRQDWCRVNWPSIPAVWPAPMPPGQQLPGDLVDEGKLLLFMKEVVVSRPPKRGKRVAEEKKRRREVQEAKRRKAPSGNRY